MKVKMLVSMAGINWSCSPNDEIDVSDDEAVRFFAAGYAEPIRNARAVETAVAVPAFERAVTRNPKKRG